VPTFIARYFRNRLQDYVEREQSLINKLFARGLQPPVQVCAQSVALAPRLHWHRLPSKTWGYGKNL